eukprot:5990505-Prymnesium_polylepis.1
MIGYRTPPGSVQHGTVAQWLADLDASSSAPGGVSESAASAVGTRADSDARFSAPGGVSESAASAAATRAERLISASAQPLRGRRALTTMHRVRRPAAPPPAAPANFLAIATVCVDGAAGAVAANADTTGEYMALTMANHAAYARAMGYLYVPLTTRWPGHTRDVRYHKLPHVRALLQNFTWVLFVDCDSLFMDFCVDVGRWPRLYDDHRRRHHRRAVDLIISGDHNWAMNSGQVAERPGPRAAALRVPCSHRLQQQLPLPPIPDPHEFASFLL